ncbi:hypothetical protein G3N95_35440, partial [Paraburkholderia sp. Tr-20389]|uniref:beta strand repeat-containing protein n=1 Tax=Paraburkholderia sp. Tr-20389 TaxID=2703903 RepID=UPI00197E3319
MSEITAGIFFSNLFGTASSSANAGTNTTDVLGTFVGIGQAVQGGVSLLAGNVDAIAKPMGGTGLVLAATGLVDNYQSIHHDLATGKNPALSDLSGAIGNVASLAGSALVLAGVGETLIVPLAVVSALAGGVQLVASATGYRVDVNGSATAVTLTASEWAQAASQLAVANSNPTLIASALSGAGINTSANTFYVPLTDANGNVVGFRPETPISSTQLDLGITQYTFGGGISFKQQATSYIDPTGQTDVVLYPSATWTIPQSNGGTTTLNLSSNGGYSGTVTNAQGIVSQQTSLQVKSTIQNGITTTTQSIASTLAGSAGALQNQISPNGSSTSEVTTVYNSDGSVSYTENKASTSGVVTSDVINANVNASLAVLGDNVILNGVAGNIVDVWGQNDVLNANGAQFTFSANVNGKVNGAGDTAYVSVSGASVTIGGNGKNAAGAQDDYVNAASGVVGTVNVLDNSHVDMSGTSITANAGANDSLGLAGYGETANVNGSGTTVWTGQNGFGASGAADDRVNFASGVVGTVNVYDNSHVDMSGTSITANAGANDSLGLAGYGETANVNGSGTTVWTGQNGFGASGAAD